MSDRYKSFLIAALMGYGLSTSTQAQTVTVYVANTKEGIPTYSAVPRIPGSSVAFTSRDRSGAAAVFEPLPDTVWQPLSDSYQERTGPSRMANGNCADSGRPPGEVDSKLRSASLLHRVPLDLLTALVRVESNFNPQARSPKGALGLMQVMPDTAKRYGQFRLLDIDENLFVGTKHLSILLEMFRDDISLALAAYNAGEGAVMRYGRRIPPYPETQNYVASIKALRRCYT